MPLSDFDNLLQDLVVGFGTPAVVARNGQRIWGRFIFNPLDVQTSPAENGVNVTHTVFYYEPGRQVADPYRVPKQHDILVIRGLEYEIIHIDRDDLGESALQLLKTGGPTLPPTPPP